MIDADQSRGKKLAIDRLPGFGRQVLASSENRHIDVAEAGCLVVLVAEQNIDEVAGTEALSRSVDRRHRLDRGIRPIPGFHGFQAGIAVAAISTMGFAEVLEDRLPAAAGRFANAKQRIELGALDTLDLRA